MNKEIERTKMTYKDICRGYDDLKRHSVLYIRQNLIDNYGGSRKFGENEEIAFYGEFSLDISEFTEIFLDGGDVCVRYITDNDEEKVMNIFDMKKEELGYATYLFSPQFYEEEV